MFAGAFALIGLGLRRLARRLRSRGGPLTRSGNRGARPARIGDRAAVGRLGARPVAAGDAGRGRIEPARRVAVEHSAPRPGPVPGRYSGGGGSALSRHRPPPGSRSRASHGADAARSGGGDQRHAGGRYAGDPRGRLGAARRPRADFLEDSPAGQQDRRRPMVAGRLCRPAAGFARRRRGGSSRAQNRRPPDGGRAGPADRGADCLVPADRLALAGLQFRDHLCAGDARTSALHLPGDDRSARGPVGCAGRARPDHRAADGRAQFACAR